MTPFVIRKDGTVPFVVALTDAERLAPFVVAAGDAAERAETAAGTIAAFTDKAQHAARVVADYAARDSIPASDRFVGLTVWVASDQRWFENRTAGSVGNTGWATPAWFVPPLQGTLAERNMVALDARERGLRFIVTDQGFPWQVHEWRKAGDPSGVYADSPPLSADAWVVLPAGIKTLRIVDDYGARDSIPTSERFMGMLLYVVSDRRLFVNTNPSAGGNAGWQTPEFFTPYSVGTLGERNRVALDARKNGFRFRVTDQGLPGVTYEWRKAGEPSLDQDGAPPLTEADWVALKADGASAVDLAEPPIRITQNSPAWSAQTEALVVGDSLSSPGYTAPLATATGLSVTRTSLGAQTSRKAALRVGALPLTLTLAGGSLPAAGSSGTVTLVNGKATTDANPDAILHTAGDGGGQTYAITGTLARAALPDPSGAIPATLAIARATITHRYSTAANTYEIAQVGGSGAVAIPDGTLFVPDWARKMATAEVWLCAGRNDTDYTETRRNLTAIIGMTRGQRVVLSGILNATTEGKGTAGLAAIKALNTWMRTTFADHYNVDAQGRDNRERLIASGNPTGDDATDRANEVIPRSLREVLPGGSIDPFHPNTAGYQVWADGAAAYRPTQAGPAQVQIGTTFAITIGGRSRQITFAP